VERALASVVSVFCFDDDGVLLASGGGVVAAPSRVVTSLSLVQRTKAIVVQGSHQWDAEVDGWRGLWNLARLEVAGCGLPALAFRASRTLCPGEALYRAGVRDGFRLDVGDAVLSDLTRFSSGKPYERSYLLGSHDEAAPGDALLDRDGRLAGLALPGSRAPRTVAAPGEWAETIATNQIVAEELMACGLFRDAILELVEALHGGKADCPSLVGALGDALQSLEQHEMALGSFRHAIRLDPENAWPHHALGTSLARLGRIAEAATALREAVRLEPGNEAYVRAARLLP
jgi:tetratricopeptide (TPR) repeat protein